MVAVLLPAVVRVTVVASLWLVSVVSVVAVLVLVLVVLALVVARGLLVLRFYVAVDGLVSLCCRYGLWTAVSSSSCLVTSSTPRVLMHV